VNSDFEEDEIPDEIIQLPGCCEIYTPEKDVARHLKDSRLDLFGISTVRKQQMMTG